MADRIYEFRDLFAAVTPAQFAERVFTETFRGRPEPFRKDAALGDPHAPAGTVPAEVAHGVIAGAIGHCGMWIARCPDPDCHGAENVSEDRPLFMCCSCFNRTNNYRWYAVLWPAERKEIEDVLLARPPMFREARPWESVEELKRENRERGFPEQVERKPAEPPKGREE